MKDEVNGKIIVEFVELQEKAYSLTTEEYDGQVINKKAEKEFWNLSWKKVTTSALQNNP